MKLSKKLMNALSEYWLTKFGEPVPARVDADKLLAQPTDLALNDPNNIFGIVHSVRSELARLGVTDASLANYLRCGFAPILYYFSHFPENKYSSEALEELVAEVLQCYERKEVNKEICRVMFRVSVLIEKYRTYERLERLDLKKNGDLIYDISHEFEKLIRLFAERISVYRSWSPNTLESCCSHIRGFLWCMEQNGIGETNNITRETISDSVTKYAERLGNGISQALSRIRIFLRLLFDEGVLLDDLSDSVPKFAPRRTVVRNGFTPDEIGRILTSIDRSARTGKRDYAIILVAVKTGLRSVDIANLKFQNIDWRTNEIKLVQQKTGNPIHLPLMPEVGNAIADYILTARPESSTEYVFVTTSNVQQHVQRTTISALVRKYTEIAGIYDINVPRRGFHSFRRSFALNLLESATPFDMLSELLGDVDINSVKPYLAIDENGLKDCAIGLTSFKSEAQSDDV